MDADDRDATLTHLARADALLTAIIVRLDDIEALATRLGPSVDWGAFGEALDRLRGVIEDRQTAVRAAVERAE